MKVPTTATKIPKRLSLGWDLSGSSLGTDTPSNRMLREREGIWTTGGTTLTRKHQSIQERTQCHFVKTDSTIQPRFKRYIVKIIIIIINSRT
jgi:hypothetical protein